MDFVIQWLSYLLAFVAGSAVAWAAAQIFLKARRGSKVSADAAGRTAGGNR